MGAVERAGISWGQPVARRPLADKDSSHRSLDTAR